MEQQIFSLRLLLLTVLLLSTMLQEAWSWRIIGGKPADPGQFPFMAVLTLFGDLQCSASIVSDNWVVSAGHCVAGISETSEFKLTAGTVDLVKDLQHAQTRDVARTILHPEYTLYNTTVGYYAIFDISLLQVAEPFVWNEYVKPITLINTMAVYEPGECMVMGFGFRDIVGTPSKLGELYYLKLPSAVRPCLEWRQTELLKDHQLCSFGGVWGEEHFFMGDSGGPLVCQGQQLGVASMVVHTDENEGLQFHTSIPYFYDWLSQYVFSRSGTLF